jgi:hypothetical protein
LVYIAFNKIKRMKKIFLLSFLGLGLNVQAQQTVTFTVEIPAGTTVTGADVTGNWLDSVVSGGTGTISGTGNWSGGLQLVNTSGNIWSASTLVKSGTYEAKFRTYNGTTTPNWESPPAACGVGANNNRPFVVGAAATTVGPYCLSTCNAACQAVTHPVNVDFYVDMANEPLTLPAGATKTAVVNVTGSFGADAGVTDWSPGSLPMTQQGASTVYKKSVAVKNKNYAFKFLKANDWNELINGVTVQYSEQSDSFAVKTCLSGSDRILDLTAAAANSTVTAAYVWESCNAIPLSTNNTQLIQRLYTAQPNPNNGTVKITFTNTGSEVFNVALVDQLGRTIQRVDQIKTDNVVLSNIAPGFYKAVISNSNGNVRMLNVVAQ